MGCTDASTFCRAGVADTPETSVLQIRGVAELRRRVCKANAGHAFARGYRTRLPRHALTTVLGLKECDPFSW